MKSRVGVLPCKFCKAGTKGAHIVYQGSGEVSAKDDKGNVTGIRNGEVSESGGGTVTPSFTASTWDDNAPIETSLESDEATGATQ